MKKETTFKFKVCSKTASNRIILKSAMSRYSIYDYVKLKENYIQISQLFLKFKIKYRKKNRKSLFYFSSSNKDFFINLIKYFLTA